MQILWILFIRQKIPQNAKILVGLNWWFNWCSLTIISCIGCTCHVITFAREIKHGGSCRYSILSNKPENGIDMLSYGETILLNGIDLITLKYSYR